jgi:hypothetical protein
MKACLVNKQAFFWLVFEMIMPVHFMLVPRSESVVNYQTSIIKYFPHKKDLLT